MIVDWQVITQHLGSSKCPSVIQTLAQRLALTSFSLQRERIQLHQIASYLLKAEMVMQSSHLTLHMGKNMPDLLSGGICLPFWGALHTHSVAHDY